MSNNFKSIDSIQGIKELDDSAAQSCVGGAFEVYRYLQNGGSIIEYERGNAARVNLNNPSNPITGFGVLNRTPLDGEVLDVLYFGPNGGGSPIATETITLGNGPTQYLGNGRVLTTNGTRAVNYAIIRQQGAPSRAEVDGLAQCLSGLC